jgi:hypothetical protein
MGQALIGAALNICLDAWQETELRKIKGSFLVLYEQTFESTNGNHQQVFHNSCNPTGG